MTKNFKKSIAFAFFLLAGITLGAFISYICAGKDYVSWLAWGQSIGLSTKSPIILDLIVFKMAFGFEINVTIAQIFTILISIMVFSKTCKSI